jgi:tRNA (uracil-5-)-methyltransferase TRM9
MDKEEKYFNDLERVYVHDVYEKISSRYDELLSLSQRSAFERRCLRHISSSDRTEDDQTSKADELRESFKGSRAHKQRIKSDDFTCFSSSLKNDLPLPPSRTTVTKNNLWPKVKKFVNEIEPFSLIADVGCGDGKYLNVNSRVLSIGSDRSGSLCRMAGVKYPPGDSVNNKNQILVCDNLALPFRSGLFDAVISIGVIHHLSAEKRRIRAVQELARVLKPNGRIMIYVWAMEQRVRKVYCVFFFNFSCQIENY